MCCSLRWRLERAFSLCLSVSLSLSLSLSLFLSLSLSFPVRGTVHHPNPLQKAPQASWAHRYSWSGHVCLRAWSCAGHWKTRCSAVSYRTEPLAAARKTTISAPGKKLPMIESRGGGCGALLGCRCQRPWPVTVTSGRRVACPMSYPDVSTARRWPHRKIADVSSLLARALVWLRSLKFMSSLWLRFQPFLVFSSSHSVRFLPECELWFVSISFCSDSK